MPKTGSCLCGAVRYTAISEIAEAGACHCSMCRKWSGGVYIGIRVPADALKIEGAENLSVFTSSDWAERAFCSTCGSSLYYRVTAPGPHHGTYHIGMGTLDDASGVEVTEEIFTDLRPRGYAFAGELKGKTEAEVMAMFADAGGDS
ncbi:GFA family protein [Roseovarius sp. CAU 1744]|uniref:GFA family protein n=1 Tax=Roseovarius sp. CAU 1744 TaxID=3140368 RepID=UPI00325BE016